MDPKEETQTRRSETAPFTRVTAFFEVLVVASIGDLLVVPLLLYLLALPVTAVFQSSAVLCLLLTAKSTVTLLTIALLLWMRGEDPAILNWGGRPVGRQILAGLLFVPLLFGVMALVGLVFQVVLPDYVTWENPLLDMIEERTDLLLFLISSIYVGGLQEEIQRAFVLTRFRQYLGGAILGLVIWSVCFGAGHLIQGVDNAVKAGFLGALFGVLYLKRGLTAPIVSHAVYDVVTVLVFWQFVRP